MWRRSEGDRGPVPRLGIAGLYQPFAVLVVVGDRARAPSARHRVRDRGLLADGGAENATAVAREVRRDEGQQSTVEVLYVAEVAAIPAFLPDRTEVRERGRIAHEVDGYDGSRPRLAFGKEGVAQVQSRLKCRIVGMDHERIVASVAVAAHAFGVDVRIRQVGSAFQHAERDRVRRHERDTVLVDPETRVARRSAHADDLDNLAVSAGRLAHHGHAQRGVLVEGPQLGTEFGMQEGEFEIVVQFPSQAEVVDGRGDHHSGRFALLDVGCSRDVRRLLVVRDRSWLYGAGIEVGVLVRAACHEAHADEARSNPRRNAALHFPTPSWSNASFLLQEAVRAHHALAISQSIAP